MLESRPDYTLRNGGETAVVEWLAATIAGTDRAVIVLYENGRVSVIVRSQNLDALTTRAFLDATERRHSDPRPGESYWDRVASQIQSLSQRRERP